MKKFSPPFWAAVKADYCSGARSIGEIATYYGVTEDTVRKHRKAGGWTVTDTPLPPIALTLPSREPPDGAAASLAPRLTKLLERTVAEIELAAGETETVTTSMDRARDVRTLATVMRLLSDLSSPQGEAGASDAPTESEQNDLLLRQEIAQRLERLREAGRLA
ncbi:MAG: hypothetical protein AAGI06_06665 [Pseudomonadota bacterium]